MASRIFLFLSFMLCVCGEGDEYQKLKDEVKSMRNEFKALKTTNEETRIEYDVLKTMIVAQGTEIGYLVDRVMKLEEKNMALEEKNILLEEKLNGLSTPGTFAPEPVVFSAALAAEVFFNNGDALKFDSVFLDTHNRYNPEFGVYTIPETGIYEITVVLHEAYTLPRPFPPFPPEISDAVALVFVNENPLVGINIIFPDGAKTMIQSPASAVRELNAGDSVYVRSANAAFYALQFSDLLPRSAFIIKRLGQMQQHL